MTKRSLTCFLPEAANVLKQRPVLPEVCCQGVAATVNQGLLVADVLMMSPQLFTEGHSTGHGDNGGEAMLMWAQGLSLVFVTYGHITVNLKKDVGQGT